MILPDLLIRFILQINIINLIKQKQHLQILTYNGKNVPDDHGIGELMQNIK